MAALKLVAPPPGESLNLKTTNELLEGATAEAITGWAQEAFAGELVLSSSFGAESAVMLHLVGQLIPNVRVVFIDTGYLFAETYRFAEELTRRFNLDVRAYSPAVSSARQEALYGKRWEGDEAERAAYQQQNKVEPMQRALQELQPRAWLSGIRQHQTAFRSSLSHVERHNGLYKVHPILKWSEADVASYMQEHALPYHPLYQRGYRSIGDEHSTFPTLEGEDARAGRALGVQKECGLHLPRSAD